MPAGGSLRNGLRPIPPSPCSTCDGRSGFALREMSWPSTLRGLLLPHAMPRCLTTILAAAAACVAVASAHAGDLTYVDVPRVTVGDAAYFKSRFEAARKGVVRIALFGDSQETAPWGWGWYYMSWLNARFAEVYGPATESLLLTDHTAVERPQWLATVVESTARTASTVAANRALPLIDVHALLDAGPTGGAMRAVLLDDASYCVDPALEQRPWFDRSVPVVAEILAIARPGSGGIVWRNAPTDGNTPDSAAPLAQSGALEFAAKTPAGQCAWFTTPALAKAGRRHVQLSISGSSAKNGTDVAGVRFRTSGAQHGVVMQGFTRGGMQLPELIQQHGESGAMLRAVGPSVAVIAYGANDAGNLPSVEAWRAQLLEAIAWIRVSMQDPAFPVIIASDLRGDNGPGPADMIDRMPVVAHQIALADPHVLALNLRRITEEEYGWGPSLRYLADTAHYRPYAQRLLAEAFVGELTRALAIADPACAQPNWADCVRTWGASCQQGGCRMLIDVEAAEFGLPWAGAGTSCVDADGDGYSDLCPPGGPYDLNHDGFVDAADLAVLLGAWGDAGGAADLNHDGAVNASDLAAFLAAWGA